MYTYVYAAKHCWKNWFYLWKYVPDIPQGSHLTSFSLVPSTKLMPGPLIIACRFPASWAFSSSRDVTKKSSYERTGITIFPKNHILSRPTFLLQNNIFSQSTIHIGRKYICFPLKCFVWILPLFFSFSPLFAPFPFFLFLFIILSQIF